ncbi:hypothetical protein PS467_20290 [Streptomyces luomodiensis]|uniref:DUF4232 domain-containing protein n=1 Tax=Streptomyces luomodiensis TaxID=3026192 RepID=A0ABY9V1G5_9ACTN|nr:hypothetical protein [Streptomyces sp. SCA4-21]WNE97503.1 hypothetical protein PS467_20290 [Streptomyces sp. SCA4-21]
MNHTTHTPDPGDPGRRDGHEPESREPVEPTEAGEGGEAGEAGEATGSAGSEESSESGQSREFDNPGQSGNPGESGDSAPSETGRVTPLHARLGDGSGGDGSGGDDEEALRRLLHHAVEDLEPSPETLDRLRRAVPARRARRRQALVGAVATVVLGCAAVPALVHVATTSDGANDHPANAASSHRTPGADGGRHGEAGGGKGSDGPSDTVEQDKGDKGKDKGKDKPSKEEEGGSGGGAPDPSNTLNATSPTCSRTQLTSSGAGSVGTADAEGRVYGAFRVVNTSDQTCTVEGSGSVGADAQGGADSSRIFVVDHTAGDAAAGLPDPATQPGTLILKPGQAYEVKFAWIPASGGGTSGCSTTGTPTPDPSTDAAQGAPQDDPSTGDPGSTPGGGGAPQDASVLVSHTPEAGDPAAASVTIGGACAGTVYRTGLLASP